jgi:hypothetical protein
VGERHELLGGFARQAHAERACLAHVLVEAEARLADDDLGQALLVSFMRSRGFIGSWSSASAG